MGSFECTRISNDVGRPSSSYPFTSRTKSLSSLPHVRSTRRMITSCPGPSARAASRLRHPKALDERVEIVRHEGHVVVRRAALLPCGRARLLVVRPEEHLAEVLPLDSDQEEVAVVLGDRKRVGGDTALVDLRLRAK